MIFFPPTDPKKIRQEQLYEAQRMVLEHKAAAEHHSALAVMYAGRITRLSVEEQRA